MPVRYGKNLDGTFFLSIDNGEGKALQYEFPCPMLTNWPTSR